MLPHHVVRFRAREAFGSNGGGVEGANDGHLRLNTFPLLSPAETQLARGECPVHLHDYVIITAYHSPMSFPHKDGALLFSQRIMMRQGALAPPKGIDLVKWSGLWPGSLALSVISCT